MWVVNHFWYYSLQSIVDYSTNSSIPLSTRKEYMYRQLTEIHFRQLKRPEWRHELDMLSRIFSSST